MGFSTQSSVHNLLDLRGGWYNDVRIVGIGYSATYMSTVDGRRRIGSPHDKVVLQEVAIDDHHTYSSVNQAIGTDRQCMEIASYWRC